jgi:membrane protease YdiL (CAAX protease family)
MERLTSGGVWRLSLRPWWGQVFSATGDISLKLSLMVKPIRQKKIGIGLLSAIILFGVFFIGNFVFRYLFGFAAGQIDQVYQLKTQASSARIFLLMALIIGPGEELFWRGFIQKQLSGASRKYFGFAVTVVLYTMVHIASGNVMLILAALVCGLAWGGLYLRYRSITLNVVSHTVWDIAVFLVFPLTAGAS